jgi:hypothetical protein
MRKKLVLLTGVLFLGVSVAAQTQYSAYTAVGKGVATTFLNDYQSLGINSSALGWGPAFEGKSVTMGTQEFAFGMTSPNLDKEKLGNASRALMNTIRDRENADFDLDAQLQAAGDYAETGIAINADYNWFGASFYNEKFGGIALSARTSYNFFAQLNEQTADIIFRGRLASYFDSLTIAINGDTSTIANSAGLSLDTLNAVIRGTASNPQTLSQLTEGTKINFSWNREFNLGYGRKLFGDSTFSLYGGIGGRIIQSIGMFDVESRDGALRAQSSLSPLFQVDYNDPNAISGNSGLLPQVTGNGYGLDLSLSALLLKKIRVATAVNNIGSVKYTMNTYSVRDTLVSSITMPGLEDYDPTSSMQQLVQDGSIMSLIGEEEIVIQNPATFRIGGSIELGKMFNVGIDVVAPFNSDNPGSLQNAVVAIGGDFKPVEWLQISAGYFGGGIYANNIPVGINFVLGGGTYEFGIASRDALSFFLRDGRSISMAFGFARFRF